MEQNINNKNKHIGIWIGIIVLGIILIVIYPHEEGKKEGTYIKKYLEDNNINYNEYHNTDNINAPYLIEIKREN